MESLLTGLIPLAPVLAHLLGSGYSHKHLLGNDYQARHLHHVMMMRMAGHGLSHHHGGHGPAQRAHGGHAKGNHTAVATQKGGLVRLPRPRTKTPKRVAGKAPRSLNHMLAEALR